MSRSTRPNLRTMLWHLRHGGFPQLAEHLRRRRRDASGFTFAAKFAGRLFTDDEDEGLVFAAVPEPPVAPRRDLRVGIIADPFTLSAFTHEWRQVPLLPKSWPSQVEDLDLLFVESAWHGNADAWQYQLTGSQAPSDGLARLVSDCRTRGIPTVFWNKEDPTHFDDFVDTAALFDWVFTTDVDCVERYRERLGHDRVAVLPFAVQERIVNPLRRFDGVRERGVAFAGTWFAHKFPERQEQMRMLFDAAITVCNGGTNESFEIFSRFQGVDPRYDFPPPYAQHVVGSLSYEQMLGAYRAYKVFLNVNTVTGSETMCARRLLEITASGTPVVTTPAPAVSHFLGTGAVQVATPSEAREAIDRLLHIPGEAERLVHLGQRELWRRHTYSHRVSDILRHVELPDTMAPTDQVSIIMATRRPQQLEHALTQVSRQQGVRVQWLLGTHGFQADEGLLAKARELGLDVEAVPLADDLTLGEVLNSLVVRADAPVISKMDDDDIYGPHYLEDLLAARSITGADVVGKYERWVHLKHLNRTVLTSPNMAWRLTDFIAGPTITGSRELFRSVPFEPIGRSEDTRFLQAAAAEGATVVAADPFNFVQVRHGAEGGHAWDVADDHFLKCDYQIDGLPLGQILV